MTKRNLYGATYWMPSTKKTKVWDYFFTLGMTRVGRLEDADLLVLAGGEDISPELYGEEPEGFELYNPERDQEEAEGVFEARMMGTPAIGICRGFQLLNVLAGIPLIQHLPNHQAWLRHMVYEGDKTGSNSFLVNSLHHQGVPWRAKYLLDYERALALSKEEPERILEGGLCRRYNFAGVQFHPEYGETHAFPCGEEAREYFKGLILDLFNGEGKD